MAPPQALIVLGLLGVAAVALVVWQIIEMSTESSDEPMADSFFSSGSSSYPRRRKSKSANGGTRSPRRHRGSLDGSDLEEEMREMERLDREKKVGGGKGSASVMSLGASELRQRLNARTENPAYSPTIASTVPPSELPPPPLAPAVSLTPAASPSLPPSETGASGAPVMYARLADPLAHPTAENTPDALRPTHSRTPSESAMSQFSALSGSEWTEGGMSGMSASGRGGSGSASAAGARLRIDDDTDGDGAESWRDADEGVEQGFSGVFGQAGSVSASRTGSVAGGLSPGRPPAGSASVDQHALERSAMMSESEWSTVAKSTM